MQCGLVTGLNIFFFCSTIQHTVWECLALSDTTLTMSDIVWHCLIMSGTAWHYLTLSDTVWHDTVRQCLTLCIVVVLGYNTELTRFSTFYSLHSPIQTNIVRCVKWGGRHDPPPPLSLHVNLPPGDLSLQNRIHYGAILVKAFFRLI